VKTIRIVKCVVVVYWVYESLTKMPTCEMVERPRRQESRLFMELPEENLKGSMDSLDMGEAPDWPEEEGCLSQSKRWRETVVSGLAWLMAARRKKLRHWVYSL